MIVIEKCTADFFILDDSKYLLCNKHERKMISLFMEYLGKKQISVKLITIDEISSLLLKRLKKDNYLNNVDLVVNIGTGGKMLFTPIKDYFEGKEIKDITCKRVWDENSLVEFEEDINGYDFQGKKVLLIDDVVATGYTLKKVIEKIERLNGIISKIVVGLGNYNFINEGNYSILMGKQLYEKHRHILSSHDEAYWYPGIYSIRHLLNEENGMPDFSTKIAELYFENDSEVIKILSRTW